MTDDQKLIAELTEKIVKALDLQDVVPDDFNEDTPLFGEGLGLDSIDALEIIVLLEKDYGIKIEDPKSRTEIFYTIRTLCDFIKENRTK